VVRNAVLILHGLRRKRRAVRVADICGPLFVAGGLLDAARYYLIMPDALGSGSPVSRATGCVRAFPVWLHRHLDGPHRLLTEGLGVNHLRLLWAHRWGHAYMALG
jgi:homoserine O-acetyltransferase